MALESSTFMYLLLGTAIAVIILQRLYGRKSQHYHQPGATESKITPRTQEKADQVTPLLDFDFTNVPPIPYRPFKSGLHVAMGIKKIQKEDWIIMDRGYLDRLDERKTVMEEHRESTIGVNDISAPAIVELFREVMEHIPKRFPTMFHSDSQTFKNLVTKKTYNLQKALHDPVVALETLSENVEEDFYLMCPDGNGEFRLQGFIACFPGGFDGPSRIGMSFKDIHGPVPGYEERIAKGVDKFVSRMKGGDIIERFNWSLQTDGKDLFRLDGNNYYPELGQTLPDEPVPIDIDQSYLRCERQSLIVLKETGAIIFTVRAYMTSLHDVVNEGNGVELADAIDSMPEKLGHYKMRPFWERDVMKYLRQQA